MQNLTYEQFMAAIVSHYGKFSSALTEEITLEYVMENFKEDDLYNVFKKTIGSISNQYNKTPSIPQFNELFFKKNTVDIEAQAKAAYAEISKYSTMYPVVFSDICSQGAVELMGGWSEFGRFNPDEVQIHRNTFCKYYKQLAEDPGGTIPKILPGSGNWYKPKPPQLIGDKVKCSQIAEAVKKNLAMIEIENMTGGFKEWQKK